MNIYNVSFLNFGSLFSFLFINDREYNAVVVGTVATAEAENICLKNGLLFHELLRCVLICCYEDPHVLHI